MNAVEHARRLEILAARLDPVSASDKVLVALVQDELKDKSPTTVANWLNSQQVEGLRVHSTQVIRVIDGQGFSGQLRDRVLQAIQGYYSGRELGSEHVRQLEKYFIQDPVSIVMWEYIERRLGSCTDGVNVHWPNYTLHIYDGDGNRQHMVGMRRGFPDIPNYLSHYPDPARFFNDIIRERITNFNPRDDLPSIVVGFEDKKHELPFFYVIPWKNAMGYYRNGGKLGELLSKMSLGIVGYYDEANDEPSPAQGTQVLAQMTERVQGVVNNEFSHLLDAMALGFLGAHQDIPIFRETYAKVVQPQLWQE